MDETLKSFVLQWLRVVAMTMVPVVFASFTSIPYSLGAHPGELAVRSVDLSAHMS